MKKNLVLSLLFVLSTLLVQAQDAGLLKVAVFDPSSSGSAIDEGTTIAVREIVSSVFVNSGEYTIVERSLLDKVMHEAKFSNTDVVDDTQATELGKLAGANKVVLSVLTQAGSKNMLSVKLIDVETARVEKQQAKVVLVEELLDEIEPLTMSLLGKTVRPKISSKAVNPGTTTSVTSTDDEKLSWKDIFKLGKSKKNEKSSQPVVEANKPASVQSLPVRSAPIQGGVKRAPIVQSVMNLISENLGPKVNRYPTDEERYEKEKSDGKLKEFVRFSAKSVTAVPQIDETQVLFFCLGDNKGGNDLLFMFMDGTMIAASTVLRGFCQIVVNDGGVHQITVWRGTAKIYSTSVNFTRKQEYMLMWDGKNIQMN